MASATDRFNKAVVGLEAPLGDGFTPTANTANVFTQPTRALWVTNGGIVNLQLCGKTGNTDVILGNVANGTLLPLRVQIIYANTTTANSFIALY